MSKKFVSDKMIAQGDPPELSYQMVWHSFGTKQYSSAFMEHLRDAEAKILKQAKEKGLLIEKEAYEKGFAQGEKDGLELGQKRIETIEQQISRLLQEFQLQRESLYKAYERELLQLVMAISKKVIRHEIRVKEEVILATLREAFRQVVDQRKVLIRVNPVDFQFLHAHPDRCPLAEKVGHGIEIMKDPSISQGGCVIETAYGDVDGTIEGQFDQIVTLLWERFAESGPLPSPEKV